MRPRTLVALFLVVVSIGTAIFVAFSVGTASNVTLTEQWVSDTGTEIRGNHHAVAAGRTGGQGMVYAPISGRSNTRQCGLVALSASNGSKRWEYPIPTANCTIHSVADPTLADYDGDGTREVLATTTEQTVAAYHPLTGEREFHHNLTAYGYTRPLVANFTETPGKEIVVTDVKGTVFVVRPNGTAVWTKRLNESTWGQPSVGDFDGDGGRELAIGLGSGDLYLLESSGEVAWQRTEPFTDSITWMTTGQADDDPGREIIVATYDGVVAAVDGQKGKIQWRHDFGETAAVHAFGDGDGDGAPEVYAVAQDGKLRSIDAADGSVEWTSTLTTGDVQMMPPPVLGEVDGDEGKELVAVSNDGIVAVVDPSSGAVQATYERDVAVFTHPRLSDTDDDGVQEIYVIYGEGRVVALSASTE